MLYTSEEDRKTVGEDGGRDEGAKTVFVVGLGMVGIGESFLYRIDPN
jgi:hypothetical protein